MRKLWKKMKNKQGFTLMEMLIVIAIIAVLVAIAIPIYSSQMHKAKVAADMANVRAYYAELQLDYLTRGEYLPGGKDEGQVPYWSTYGSVYGYDCYTLSFPVSNLQVKLQAGLYSVDYGDPKDKTGGYSVTYHCTQSCYNEHSLTLS